MSQPNPPSQHDPRAAEAMQRSMAMLNDINGVLGVNGYAHLLDTATPEEMTEILAALTTFQTQIERTKALLKR